MSPVGQASWLARMSSIAGVRCLYGRTPPRLAARSPGVAGPATAGPPPARPVMTGCRGPLVPFPFRRRRSRADPRTMSRPRTLVEKIWDDHVVAEDPGAPALLAIDLHLVHEVTSPQAFTGLRQRGLTVRRPDRTVATADHSTPTTPRGLPMVDLQAVAQIRQLETNCRDFGIPIHAFGSDTQGIVHVIG